MNSLTENLFLEWPVFDLTTDVEASTIWEDDWAEGEVVKSDDFGVLLSVGLHSVDGDDLLELTLASSCYQFGMVSSKDLNLDLDTPLFSGTLKYGSGALSWHGCITPLTIDSDIIVQVYLNDRKMLIVIEPR